MNPGFKIMNRRAVTLANVEHLPSMSGILGLTIIAVKNLILKIDTTSNYIFLFENHLSTVFP